MLNITGAQAFNAGIDKWLTEVEDLAVGVHRGLAVKLFEAVLRNSPQFSGNAVANWKFSVNGKDSSYDDYFKELLQDKEGSTRVKDGRLSYNLDLEVYSKTNPNQAAESYAISNASGKELGVTKLSDVIYISNSVEYEAWLAKATEANLREANHVGHLISHSADDVIEGHLFITTTRAQELGRERIA